MLISLKYFGMLVEITNSTQENYTVNSNDFDLGSIEQLLLQKYPDLKKATYNIAVNQKMVDKNYTVKNGDELAFLPPFAGG